MPRRIGERLVVGAVGARRWRRTRVEQLVEEPADSFLFRAEQERIVGIEFDIVERPVAGVVRIGPHREHVDVLVQL